MEELIRSWSRDDICVEEMLAMVRAAFPDAGLPEIQAAMESVARGGISAASPCAAATVCHMVGLGDPLETASRLYSEGDGELSEPQWFLWIAGYSYNWIANSGLSACYFSFPARQYADRVRVYEVIGAESAAEAMRAADAVFGAGGPPPAVEDRSRWCSDEAFDRLDAMGSRFTSCGDEIFTRAFLYALEHPRDFRAAAGR